MELQSVKFFLQMQDGGIQDGCIELKMATFRLNLERVCIRFYGSINPIESVKLPSVNYLDNPRWRHSRWRYPKWRHFVVLRRSTALSP